MHTEEIYITKKTISQLIEQKKDQLPIVAVGTTSLRTLETLYFIGQNILENKPFDQIKQLSIDQWNATKYTPIETLKAILNHLNDHQLDHIHAKTQILIQPNCQFRLVDGLITNFHQPKSTLLLLISAFVGGNQDWKTIYNYALSNDFRFLSYGDSSLLWRH